MRHRENDVSALVGAVDFLYAVCFKAVKRFLFGMTVRVPVADRNHGVFALDVDDEVRLPWCATFSTSQSTYG